jgi:hypothetical protein
MSFNSTDMIPEVQDQFDRVLALISSPEAQEATLDQMERHLLRAVDGAYAKAVAVLEHLLAVTLPVAAAETGVAEQAAAVEAFYAAQAPPSARAEGPLLVVQADGKGVPRVRAGTDEAAPAKVRRSKGDKKTRKKEAIVTAVSTVERIPRPPEAVVTALFHAEDAPEPARPPRPAPHPKRVFASLDGKAAAVQRVATWAAQRDGRSVQERVALTDGAQALQEQLQIQLPAFTRVLDIIHVSEHLWEAGTALYGETDPQRAAWVEAHLLDLVSSRGQAVIDHLEARAARTAKRSLTRRVLQQTAQYFRRNLPSMDYATYLRRGWPIATGVIEGACRHLVKDRMELAGMRWTVPGATAILALRAVHENGDWDAFHAFRRERCHKRLYHTPLPTAWIAQAERLEIN